VALYFSINRVGSGFDFDHPIERVAVRQWNDDGWSAAMSRPQHFRLLGTTLGSRLHDGK
jgi:hypothetical protein